MRDNEMKERSIIFKVPHVLHVPPVQKSALPSFPILLSLPLPFTRNSFMSQHRSLRSSGTIAAKRNVLKRFERVDLLKKRGQWKDGRSVMNLPKTKPDA